MNIIEAYRYLQKGYWIKRKNWKRWSRLGTIKDRFGSVDAEGLLFCPKTNGAVTLIVGDDVLADDWEVKMEDEDGNNY